MTVVEPKTTTENLESLARDERNRWRFWLLLGGQVAGQLGLIRLGRFFCPQVRPEAGMLWPRLALGGLAALCLVQVFALPRWLAAQLRHLESQGRDVELSGLAVRASIAVLPSLAAFVLFIRGGSRHDLYACAVGTLLVLCILGWQYRHRLGLKPGTAPGALLWAYLVEVFQQPKHGLLVHDFFVGMCFFLVSSLALDVGDFGAYSHISLLCYSGYGLSAVLLLLSILAAMAIPIRIVVIGVQFVLRR